MSPLRIQLAALVGAFSGQVDPVSGTGQACRCGQSPYQVTPGTEHPHRSEEVRKLPEDLYTEGGSSQSVGRVLGAKSGTVYSHRSQPQGPIPRDGPGPR